MLSIVSPWQPTLLVALNGLPHGTQQQLAEQEVEVEVEDPLTHALHHIPLPTYDAGSIRCQRARCETVWVSHTSNTFRILTDDGTHSITLNACMRMHDQGHGLVRPTH